MTCEGRKLLQDRAKALSTMDMYCNVSITAEGYGSILEEYSPLSNYFAQAESLRKCADKNATREAISDYMESLLLYVRALTFSNEEPHAYAARIRQICKFVDEILAHARKYDMQHLKNILKWATFNMKTQLLFIEVGSFSTSNDPKALSYLINEVKTLSYLFASRGFRDFTLVGIESLEAETRQRLSGCSK